MSSASVGAGVVAIGAAQIERDAHRGGAHERRQRAAAAVREQAGRALGAADDQPHPGLLDRLVDARRVEAARREVPRGWAERVALELIERARGAQRARPRQDHLGAIGAGVERGGRRGEDRGIAVRVGPRGADLGDRRRGHRAHASTRGGATQTGWPRR